MARALNLINSDEPFFGHKACAGCGGSLAVRIALKVLGDRAIAILPAGCMSAVGFNFPQLAFGCNAMISTFAGTASLMTGVAAGMKRKGETDFTVVGFAGDGGTADIGIQALSGAIDRNDDILYICYDNEAYMNTGIQQSSLTPYGASTTTSPVDRNGQATLTQKKDMFRIVSAMGRPRAWGTWTITRQRSRRRAISTGRSSSTCSLHARPGGEARSTRRWSSRARRSTAVCGGWRNARAAW